VQRRTLVRTCAIRGREEGAVRIEVRALTPPGASQQVEGEHEQDPVYASAARDPRHFRVLALRERVPAFVPVDVAGEAVMDPVAETPGVERNEQERVGEVPDPRVQVRVAREGSVPAVVAHHLE
jgi:hypothetical protein